jgi:hypothetical protein
MAADPTVTIQGSPTEFNIQLVRLLEWESEKEKFSKEK